MKKFQFLVLLFFVSAIQLVAEDGYRLWLKYDKIENDELRQSYIQRLSNIEFYGTNPILTSAKTELTNGLSGLLGINVTTNQKNPNGIIAGVIGESPEFDKMISEQDKTNLKSEGFVIFSKKSKSEVTTIIAGKDASGVLYGSFHLLRHLQKQNSIQSLHILENPKIKLRVLNHWDNLDGTVERGYAGFSIWNWHQLPEFIDQRYIDYARANASIGINGAAVTNVNANSLIFRPDYIEKAKALADVFRNYGIKLYLTARFSSPIEAGGLETADPLDPQVQQWWNEKVAEIYKSIPDFGGFVVKANSEGQPGPQQYGRNHEDGANMLADALSPFGGVVMWRAFVYSSEEPRDRSMQAYDEFVPHDGKFRKNVLIQVKNGPIDFQPREPIHPLFGAMPNTSLMMEFQITKEYLGQGTHLVGLSKMFEEVLKTDTYAKGKGSLVAKVIDGTLENHELTGIAGVANIGTARNWTGNLFGQADWYAYGRLAWDPYMDSEQIFSDWTKMTFSNDPKVESTIIEMLNTSHETCIKYMTPLGLHHIMGANHHYGPGPWVSKMSRADWTSVYYHKADEKGIGFDRTKDGSQALLQYSQGFIDQYKDMENCPLENLLWFHHVPWDYKLSTGNTLWEELCIQYHEGSKRASYLLTQWDSIEPSIDEELFRHVKMHLQIQQKEAKWWRDACLSYFMSFSKMKIPDNLEQPKHDLDYYESLNYPYSPGIRPRW